MPLIATRGAASAQGFGEFAQTTAPVYIEDVFSTYLYTGTGSAQTITNNIDLSTEGGLVWLKSRSQAYTHLLYDTARGTSKDLRTNSTNAQANNPGDGLSAFNSNGFSIPNTAWVNINESNTTYASWTFRKAKKFFDVVTYTGATGNAVQNISHNLGSVPGCIIVKCYDQAGYNWIVYHRSLGATQYLYLNTTGAAGTFSNFWNDTAPTSTQFTVGTSGAVNGEGQQYVAYLFAHNAGGFGLTGSDNVISCGLCTADGSGNFSATLGYEPQWVLIKSTGSGIWSIVDNMRGATASSGYTSSQRLQPQSSAAEDTLNSPYGIGLNATGFTGNLATFSNDFIYIAIRRGPMKTPTSGTSVYQGVSRSGTGATATITAGFPVDLIFDHGRTLGGSDPVWQDRLRGIASQLFSNSASAESTRTDVVTSFASNTSITVGADGNNYINTSGFTFINWMFQRAPGFFDVVCYTGTGGTGSRSLSHNLNSTPEFIILKRRDAVSGWQTGSMFTSTTVTRAVLNLNNDQDLNSLYTGQSIWGGQPTSTAFLIGASGSFNTSAATYVAYLFATVAGVSKVGSYTGTGALQTVNCGFTTGARFVLIKRTDSTGDWWVYDSARGISSGNDPYVFLNSGVAEVTNTNYVDTTSVGFQVTAAAPAGLNANGGTFLFLAVA